MKASSQHLYIPYTLSEKVNKKGSQQVLTLLVSRSVIKANE